MTCSDVVLIPCAGEAERWGNYGGVPKQLTRIDGATLLEGIVRRFRARLPSTPIYIITRDERMATDGARLCEPDADSLGCDYDKLWCCRSLWSTAGRTWIVWGDLWISTAGADAMCCARARSLVWYGRSRPSEITGKAWDELFGLSFAPAAHERLAAACQQVTRLWHWNQLLDRPMAWHVYQQTLGRHPNAADKRSGLLVEIDDGTDDFDAPRDLVVWMTQRQTARAHNRGDPFT